jgi:hypothetical protein
VQFAYPAVVRPAYRRNSVLPGPETAGLPVLAGGPGSFATHSRWQGTLHPACAQHKAIGYEGVSAWIDQSVFIPESLGALTPAFSLYVSEQIEDKRDARSIGMNSRRLAVPVLLPCCGKQNQLAELRQCPPAPF